MYSLMLKYLLLIVNKFLFVSATSLRSKQGRKTSTFRNGQVKIYNFLNIFLIYLSNRINLKKRFSLNKRS